MKTKGFPRSCFLRNVMLKAGRGALREGSRPCGQCFAVPRADCGSCLEPTSSPSPTCGPAPGLWCVPGKLSTSLQQRWRALQRGHPRSVVGTSPEQMPPRPAPLLRPRGGEHDCSRAVHAKEFVVVAAAYKEDPVSQSLHPKTNTDR